MSNSPCTIYKWIKVEIIKVFKRYKSMKNLLKFLNKIFKTQLGAVRSLLEIDQL